MHSRFADVDVRCATAEELPFADAQFDVAAAQLVVHFMADPVAGLAEMAQGHPARGCRCRVRLGSRRRRHGALSLFWAAVRQLDPMARDESGLAGSREGHLAELFKQAGLAHVAVVGAHRAGRP